MSTSTLFWVSYAILWVAMIGVLCLMGLMLRQFGLVYLKTAGGVSRSGAPIGAQIPSLQLTTLDHEPLSLAAYKGAPVLLVFLSPNCGPCRELRPHLTVFEKEHRNTRMIVFSMGGTESETTGFLADTELQSPIVYLSDRQLYESAFKGDVTPFAFLLDSGLRVASKGIVNNTRDLEHLYHAPGARTHDIQLEGQISV